MAEKKSLTGMKQKKVLTSKQESFCRAFVSGGDQGQGMSLSDAYRYAFDVDPSTKSSTVNSMASRLHRLPHVRDMIDSLLKAKRAGSVASALSRRDKVLRYFEQVMDGEIETDQLKLKASELLGRGVNLFSTDINVSDTRQKNASELAGEIEALLLASQEEVTEPDILDPEDGEIH